MVDIGFVLEKEQQHGMVRSTNTGWTKTKHALLPATRTHRYPCSAPCLRAPLACLLALFADVKGVFMDEDGDGLAVAGENIT